MQLRQFSTLAVVHFALNKQSINILIQKGVMNLFNSFREDGEKDWDSASVISGDLEDQNILQTNISWIFLALCNNGISGLEMLRQGITKVMFLVACNPHDH